MRSTATSNHLLSVPVKAVRQATHNTKVITFGLPDGVSLSLPVSSCIMMEAPGYGKDGKALLRCAHGRGSPI